MLFSLPSDTISGITAFTLDFFNSIKSYIVLALGTGLGLILLGYTYEIFFSYGVRVRKEARRRFGIIASEIEEEEFEEDVEEKLNEMMLD